MHRTSSRFNGSRYARLWASPLVCLSCLLLTGSTSWAQDGMIADHQFAGAAKRDGVVVRSGPTPGHSAVMTLALDQEVTVVNASGDFLRVLPPDGTFCMVAKQWVEVSENADGTRSGKINASCTARSGSRLNGMPGETIATLSAGDEVTIIGEDSSYWHITPPRSVFYYIHHSELRQLREVKVQADARGWAVAEVGVVAAPAGSGGGDSAAEEMEEELDSNQEVAQSESRPPSAADAIPDAVIPTTRPALLTDFMELDARYNEMAKLSLEEQPLEELKGEYNALLERATAESMVTSLVPAIKARIETIELRQAALQDLVAMQAMRQQMAQRQQAMEAEQDELAERAASAKVTVYAAVGQLRPSTLQVGGGALYRLCDPATGRTMIYLRADAEQTKDLARQLERFIGVKGETMSDKTHNLKFIKVSEMAAVDPQQLFKSVAAELIPPSLLQNAAAAE